MSCVSVCDCNFSMSNTGTDCQTAMEVTKKLILVPIYDSTGARNYVDLTTTLNTAYFTAFRDQADTSKRWYPIPELKDVKDARDTPIVQQFADGTSLYVREGARKFEGMIVGKQASPQLKGKIESARCGPMGVYLIDRNGSLIGIVSEDKTKLYPIRLDSDSITAQWATATDTTVQAINLVFNFHPDENDACLGMVLKSEMDDADLLMLRGLINVYVTISGISQTGATAAFYNEFGTPINPKAVTGLETTDFESTVTGDPSKIRNTTDGADIAITATESTVTPGTYTLAWASQTVSDVLHLGLNKSGFDFTNVNGTVITIV